MNVIPKKIIYLNCTAIAPHIGCMAVTNYHFSRLLESGCQISDIIYCNHPWASLWTGNREESIDSCLKSGLGKRIAAADVVVINGEGTLHHAPGMGMLVATAAARQLAKPVYLTNTSIFSVEGFDDVLMDLQDLNVRESESSDFLEKRGIPHRLVLDSFLGARFLEYSNQNLEDKTVVMDWHPGRDKDVGRSIIQYYESLPEGESHFLPLNHHSHVNTWRHTVANLATAALIVTGRYHGVYLAGLAGVPFVALPSNTAKIQGLIRSSGLPLPLCENHADIAAAATNAKKNPALFKEFNAFLLEQLPLSTFDPLVSSLHGENNTVVNETRGVLEAMEAQIETARVEEQHKNLYRQMKNRVEMTPRKQLEHIGSLAIHKLRKKAGL